jgi:hypothetical protein
MLVKAQRDFISPTMGDITTGQVFDCDDGIAYFWLGAGLVAEFKPMKWEELQTKPHVEKAVETKKVRKRKNGN